ncbi:MAG: Sir2 family NAD-dependent protein deacetylase, partial [Chloroflexota bacterium]|nr:Sir2 family NAD-dependent protein deacetylase [Chloroflexota bacterium]
PNPGHRALAELERLGLLKCVITQNMDGLHPKAGSRNVVEYHGSVHKLRCPACGSRYTLDEVSFRELPPRCTCGGAMKYDVVHFKEPIPFDVMERSEREALECDLMLICGTSAVVYPFANLPRVGKMGLGPSARIIEINAEPTPLTREGVSDYFIQGKTGEILPQIVKKVTDRLT